MSLDSVLLIMWIFEGFLNYSLPSMQSKITIINHEVHSYQSCEMPLRLCNEILGRINDLLLSHSENNPGGEEGRYSLI